jgi:hypothetical protein
VGVSVDGPLGAVLSAHASVAIDARVVKVKRGIILPPLSTSPVHGSGLQA